jgi:hypothetical protein
MKRLFSTAKLNRLIKANRKGFSLVTVASLGAVTMMWLMAISASVLPMYTRAAQARYTTVVRSAAEASLDYAVNTLKTSINGGVISSNLDDGVVHNVPSDVLSADPAMEGQMLAKIKVVNMAPPQASSIYQKQNDVDAGTGTFPNLSSGVTSNGWRVVVAAAEYANQVRGIRVILEPKYDVDGIVAVGNKVPTPYFQFGMFGQSSIAFTGNADVDAYDSTKGAYTPTGTTNRDLVSGDVGSNANPPPSGATITLGSNTTIYGDLVSFSGGSSSSHTQLDATGGGIVNDQLKINGTTDIPVNSIKGADEATWAPLNETKITTLDDNAQMPVPLAQTAPTTSQVVSAELSVSGNTTTVAPPGPNQVVNLGTLAVSGNNTYILEPGDYQVSSIAISGNGSITIAPASAGNTATAVRLFVQGNASGSDAIQIAGNGMVNNGTPSNLQIWYGGSKGTKINGNGSFTGVVYAPNSAIEIKGNGEVFGAVVGYTVEANGNGNIHFDTALRTKSQELGLSYLLDTTTNIPDAKLASLRTISWQELTIDQLRTLGLYPLH